VTDTVLTEVRKNMPTTLPVIVTVGDLPAKDMGMQHKSFPRLLKMIASGCNVWIKGPAGSGKTYAVMQAAKAFEASFYYTGAVGDAYALLGYKDAKGEYQGTSFRQAYEHGGLFLWDEVDASDANALLAFNAALENGCCAFPDRLVSRHPDFKCVAAGNTVGQGATQEYVGRNRLDTAFLSRFVTLDWEYDEALELATTPDVTWTKRVQTLRARAKVKGLRVLITPRASYMGGRLLAAGLSRKEVEDATIAALMTPDQYAQVGG
jgi:cobaltochelatase CobS